MSLDTGPSARSLASEEISPHLVMQAWEKHSIQHVAKAGGAGRDWSDYTQMAALPAKPDHGAPLRHDCVVFGQEHANSSIQTTASST
jgi:hypothetical protein